MIKISYDGLPCTMLRMIANDSLPINPDDWNCPETVVTIFCTHPKQQGASNLNTAIKQIREQGQYKCQCGQPAKQINELAKDVKRHIAITFHKSTQEVNIKLGIILHKYKRPQRYQDALNNFIENNKQSFLDMQDRFHEQNSITNILIKQQYQEKQISLWAYCLLDRVKINIPVRIINCNHADCYELTSLLLKFDQMQKEKKPKFQCEFNGCNNHLMMENFQTMASELMIDLDYLNVLNAAPTTQFKFKFDFQNKEFVKSPDFDPVIDECLKGSNIPENQQELTYNSILNHISMILNSDALENAKIKQLLNSQKFEDRKVNLIDQFTKKPIEFPVRCHNCPSSKCIDIRTLITDYELKKKLLGYQCPLCFNKLEQRNKNFKGLIYLDQSLLSKMFKDQQNNSRENFFYNGKQYMKEEFIYKQKLSKEDYLNGLDRDHPEKNRVAEFKNPYCTKNTERQLQTPLIILNCPQSNIVDFETFYEEFKKQNFNIETNGIILCVCEYCNIHPITKYTAELAYHEALGYAIENSTMKTIQKGSILKFDFKVKEQVLVFGQKQIQNQITNDPTVDGMVIKNNKNQITQGFIEILDDEEYKNVFAHKQLQGKNFQVLSMQVEVMDGLTANCNSQGVNVQIDQKIQQMNQNANQDLKKWNFQVTGMEVKVLGFQSGIQSQSFNSSQIQK